jgi:low affinity Fe/Cu permease
MNELFRKFSHHVSKTTGSAYAFALAFILIVAWLVTGPVFDYSNTWQLVINTFTTIVTFLMVFLIQNTQNRDTKAVHLKLDELLRAMEGARNSMIDVEDLSDEDLEKVHQEFENLHEKAKSELHRRKTRTSK